MAILHAPRNVLLTCLALAALSLTVVTGNGQPTIAPQNDAPNPSRTSDDWATLPTGRTWG